MIDKRILISLVENVSQNSKANRTAQIRRIVNWKLVYEQQENEELKLWFSTISWNICYIYVQINIGLTYFN